MSIRISELFLYKKNELKMVLLENSLEFKENNAKVKELREVIRTLEKVFNKSGDESNGVYSKKIIVHCNLLKCRYKSNVCIIHHIGWIKKK